MIKNFLVSTAPCYCLEQFHQQICQFLLLVKYKSSSTPSPFSLFYCSNSPVRAVVIKQSPVSTAPCYSPEQFYHQICHFLLLAENKSSSTFFIISIHYCSDAHVRAVVIKHSSVSTAPDYIPEQFYHQICHFLLLVKYKSSSTFFIISLHYCSDSPLRAVVIKHSSVSTAPCYCLEQFYRQICHFLLLAENLSSSTLSTFSLHYCSDASLRAVVIKHSPVSTAPCYCPKQ